MKKSSVVLIAGFVTAVLVIVPITWNAMQAELAQSRNMTAMRDSLEKIEQLAATTSQEKRCPASLRDASHRLTQASGEIDSAFSYLAGGSEQFRQLSQALQTQVQRFSTMSQSSTCVAASELAALKQQCKQCHEQFRNKNPRREQGVR